MPKRARPPRLPIALTTLLGRSREVEELTALLGRTRLLTITGAGGSGKTSLALELAHRVADSRDLAAWVDLAAISDPDAVGQQLLSALGIRELAPDDVLEVVLDSIRDEHALIVFDNCEHLVEASAIAAEAILRSCPNTTILATSREALGVGGEQSWLVPPLTEPDAVALFVERAKSALPAFSAVGHEETIAQICRRLDGIPLAIELAAARVNVVPPPEIARRLDDAFALLSSGSRTLPRHRTIRETIDWSYRLLSSDEQTLLRRLSVFGGRFSLAAAEAVCGEGLDVLPNISALVGKSLLIAEGTRYRMLDTVRQFAALKLEAAGETTTLREAHARYVLEKLEGLEPRLFGGAADAATLAVIDDDIGNIRAILDGSPSSEAELRLVSALYWYSFARGYFVEARKRIDGAIARAGGAVDPHLLARAHVASALAAIWQGDWEAVRSALGDAADVMHEHSDHRGLAVALMASGIAFAFHERDHEAARDALEAAVATATRHGDREALVLTLYWSGIAARRRADWSAAHTALEESVRIGKSIDNPLVTAHALSALGHIALRESDREKAIELLAQALEIESARDDRWGMTQVVEGVGLALLDAGDAENGTRLIAATGAAWLHLGARAPCDTGFEDRMRTRIVDALGDERLRIVLASGAAMSYDAMVAVAREQLAALRSGRRAPLRIEALGRLQVSRDGERVEESARSRELLLYLLCHPAGRTKEQIGAALWPDATPAKLRNNFHVTMHRLRKALGAAEWIVVDGDTYALDRSRGVELDCEMFEREAAAALRSSDVRRLERAVALYRGDFFEDAGSGDWFIDARTRFREIYARLLDTLGRARAEAGDHAEAAEAWQRLTELDDLDEEAARKLVQALSKAGDPSAAKRAYRRLADALRRELGVEPSFSL
jgi:predicted ATPase/DNA-binding SARP family transcriptional activator